MKSDSYKDLGNRSAVEPSSSVALSCDICRVRWIGCWDEAACPLCGNHDSWDKLMQERNEAWAALEYPEIPTALIPLNETQQKTDQWEARQNDWTGLGPINDSLIP